MLSNHWDTKDAYCAAEEPVSRCEPVSRSYPRSPQPGARQVIEPIGVPRAFDVISCQGAGPIHSSRTEISGSLDDSRLKKSRHFMCSFVSGGSMICNPTFRRNLLSLKRLQSDLTVAHILKSRGERSKSFRRRLGGLWKTFHIPWGSVHGLAEVVFHPTRCFFPTKCRGHRWNDFLFLLPLLLCSCLRWPPLNRSRENSI